MPKMLSTEGCGKWMVVGGFPADRSGKEGLRIYPLTAGAAVEIQQKAAC